MFGCNSLVSKDLVETAWGWNKLLPFRFVSWSDYIKYLEQYYLRNARQFVPGAAATTGSSSIAALAEIVSNFLSSLH